MSRFTVARYRTWRVHRVVQLTPKITHAGDLTAIFTIWQIIVDEHRSVVIISYSLEFEYCRGETPRSSYLPSSSSSPSAISSVSGFCKNFEGKAISLRNYYYEKHRREAVNISFCVTLIWGEMEGSERGGKTEKARGKEKRRLTKICKESTKSFGPCQSRYPPAEFRANLGPRFPVTLTLRTHRQSTEGQALSEANVDWRPPKDNDDNWLN